MQHVAIDLGSKESQVCIRREDGSIVLEKKHPTRRLGELMQTWPKSRVILETSSESFRVADAAIAANHEVRVVPATLAKQLGVGERGVKTDVRDARKLSEVSCRIDLRSVHIPSAETRELRSILRSREALVTSRTKLINHVKGWIRTQLWRLRSGATATLPDRLRAHAVMLQQSVPVHIEETLVVLETLTQQITASTRRVKKLAKEHSVARRLMTIPGVGPITALTFIAAVDQVDRFERTHHLQSYLGLTPGENSSSERERRTGITKAGSTAVRRTLVQAAWAAMRLQPNAPMVKWAAQIAERRGRFIAVVALARKMAGIMFALWRDDSTYSAFKAAASMH
jgi:transposase